MNENKTNELSPMMIDMEEPIATPIAIKPKRPRGRPAKVGKQMFIDAWNNSQNLNEVAAMLSMPRLSASVKASNLRKTGCDLKMFRRGRKRKTAI